MISQLLSILAQAGVFVLGVYLQKFIRKRIYSKEEGKRVKQTTRILTCAVVTVFLLFFNYQQTCSPLNIIFSDCFYLNFSFNQVLLTLIANSFLFGAHIYEKFVKSQVDFSQYTIKGVFFAPLLQEVLFRASFFRTSAHQVPLWILALIFSLSHLHRPIRKLLKGKNPSKNQAINQVIFTFIFGCYSFYYLSAWQSIIPSVALHCYCNFLGPPRINKQNKFYHLGCIMAMLLFNYIFI